MLTTKQRQYLRGLAHSLRAIYQVGKSGIGDTMVEQLLPTLEARELIKISVLKNCMETPEDVGRELARRLDAELVQVIGRIVILYRPSSEHREIVLPR